MSPVARFIGLVREQQARGLTLSAAVRWVAARDRWLTLAVLDIIGSWPSSEPELAELQRSEP